MRLINPLAADDPNGKVATCARNVIRIWEQTKEQRSAQLVFCDLSTPKQEPHRLKCKKNGDGVYEMIPDQFTDVYNDLKKKLMAEPASRRRKSPLSMMPTPKHEKKELFCKSALRSRCVSSWAAQPKDGRRHQCPVSAHCLA